MFIEKVQNNGNYYLRLVNSIRVENKNGYKVSQKKVILNIGPLSKYDDGLPDYMERLKKSFAEGTPLIKSLLPYCTIESPVEKYKFEYIKGAPECKCSSNLISCFLLERIIEEFGLRSFFNANKNSTKIDAYGFFKLLVFERLLNPTSKLDTIRQNENYFEPIIKGEYNSNNVYETIDFIANNHDKILKRINTNLIKKTTRKNECIFCSVTNFHYDIEGPNNENRNQSIVQIGLFTDNNGLPITIEILPSNHLTFKSTLSKSVSYISHSRFILVADRGISNILQVINSSNGYIMPKSLHKSNVEQQEFAYNDAGYSTYNHDVKLKSRIVRRLVKDENNQDKEIVEKTVVYFSKSCANKANKENKSFFEFLDKIMNSSENFRVSTMQAKSLERFLNNNSLNQKTEKIFNSNELRAKIDLNKVNAYKKSFGYYQLVTSELSMDDKEVIDKYHMISETQCQFRIMTSDFNTQPICERNPDHVKSHFLTCMVALTIIRIIQNKLIRSGFVPYDQENIISLTQGLSAKRIQDALNMWTIQKTPCDYYMMQNTNENTDLALILKAFEVDIPDQLFRLAELKQIKSSIKNIM